jgi:hypothetical protein
MGMILVPILANPDVNSVRVIEISESLREMMEPLLRKLPGAEKLTIQCADIFEYRTKDRFNCLWFDIWKSICTDNLIEIAKLHRRWAHRKNPGDSKAFMASCQQDYLRAIRDQERRGRW